jgi:hypothetical protein
MRRSSGYLLKIARIIIRGQIFILDSFSIGLVPMRRVETLLKALTNIIMSPDFGTHLYIFPRWPIFNTRTQTTLS